MTDATIINVAGTPGYDVAVGRDLLTREAVMTQFLSLAGDFNTIQQPNDG